ncbi:hypothetical protein [Agromyces larvae]|uniref:RES domain-containing protein n=1 Tax=Agromyces larvae TaxID=2929802 RepID=A0ABY4C5Z3_9MICO|nr:hypothetical protein [Agromyces larvae]UOE45506.1 hypothetical protein MTO99_07040 [Agromyces larvae]
MEPDEGVNLSHYTAEPFVFDRTRTYDQTEFGNGKPRGLWLSVDGEDDWPAWCRNEQFRLETLEHRAVFTIAADAEVLRIGNLGELKAFTAEYRDHPAFAGTDLGSHWIDWPRVAARYDGILITPYLWDARYDLNSMWYYGWDCASGCVWNLAALVPADVLEVTS